MTVRRRRRPTGNKEEQSIGDENRWTTIDYCRHVVCQENDQWRTALDSPVRIRCTSHFLTLLSSSSSSSVSRYGCRRHSSACITQRIVLLVHHQYSSSTGQSICSLDVTWRQCDKQALIFISSYIFKREKENNQITPIRYSYIMN